MALKFENLREITFQVPVPDDHEAAAASLARFRRSLRAGHPEWLDADEVLAIHDEICRPSRWAWVLHGTGSNPLIVDYRESRTEPPAFPGDFRNWLEDFAPVSPDDFAWATPLYWRLRIMTSDGRSPHGTRTPWPTVDRLLLASRGWILDSEAMRNLIKYAGFDPERCVDLASFFDTRDAPLAPTPERRALRAAGMQALADAHLDGASLLDILEERCLCHHTFLGRPPYEIGSRLFAAVK